MDHLLSKEKGEESKYFSKQVGKVASAKEKDTYSKAVMFSFERFNIFRKNNSFWACSSAG